MYIHVKLNWTILTWLLLFKKLSCLRIGPHYYATCAYIASLEGNIISWATETRYLGIYIHCVSYKTWHISLKSRCFGLHLRCRKFANIFNHFYAVRPDSQNRYIWLPLLCLTPTTEEFPWDDLHKIFCGCQWVAKVSNAVKILPKILTGWLGCASVTDDRHTTDDRRTGDII